MKELITRVEELAVQASRDARQIETLQGLLKASQSDLMAELTDAIERKKKIDQLASENAALIVSECGHKKAAREAQEKYEESHRLHSLAVEARNNAQEEVRKLRAEVPLESTREALKNAVAKLQEVTTDRDRIREISKSLVPKSALKQAVQEAAELRAEVVKLRAEVQPESQVDTLERQANGLRAEMASLANQLMDAKAEAGGIRGHAHSWGCKEDETVTAFMQRLSIELAEAKTDLADTIAKTTDLGSYAMTLGRKEGEPLEMFMERQAVRLAALESKAGPSIEALSAELSVRYAEIAELHKWAAGLIESPAFAHYHYERVQEYNAIVARINSRPQLDLTATLPTVDWQVVARNLEQTVAGLNAKVAELEAQCAYATKVASQLGERIAYVQKQSMALETLVMRIKSYRNTEAVQQCALIHQLIDATDETMGTRLTA